jgi:prepilin-type processing-associated H-X9-DG protein
MADWTGSYAFNGWFYREKMNVFVVQGYFRSENEVKHPTTTPTFADANWPDASPQTNETAAANLYLGNQGWTFLTGPISRIAISRHGSKPPSAAPRDWPANQPLPRAWGVNVSFVDGHVRLVKLPDLWSLTWHKNWDSPSNPKKH